MKILTIGEILYTQDKRFSPIHNEGSNVWILRLWYSTTDDTKHRKSDNHHVVIRTGDNIHGECDDGFLIDPFFDCLSSFQSVTKDTKGNVEHNFTVFQDACYGDEFVLSCYGGNTSDNPARQEGIRTFEATMNSNEEWRTIYGVERWPITHNDPFHNCNLGLQHTSEKGLGKTEKGNNRQIHHRQAMQTLRDIVSSDPALADIVAEEVLDKIYEESGCRYDYTIKMWRERIQR